MIPITTKITLEQRNYLDREIKAGKIASYGHAFRFLIHFYRTNKRVIERLKSENAVFKAKVKDLIEERALQKEGL